jgi:hypothetical protein
VVVVVVVVVMMMMVMRDDGDARRLRWKQMMMTKYAGSNFLEKPFAGPFGNWWCLCCWCLGGLSIVFRWSLVSCVAFWWCVRGCLVVCSVMCFAHILVVFLWCLGAVTVVFLGVLKEWHFLG